MSAVLAVCIAIIYCPSRNAPFIFDDDATIVTNDSIVSLWPLFGSGEQRGPLRPHPFLPTGGRPLVNLSFAVNYHIGGLTPRGYHVVSMLMHFGSALLLWAIVKRTLLVPLFAGEFERSAGWLALAVALLWTVHPLQTETVIYATQRTELLMAWFYLATLYCSLRYWTSDRLRSRWLVLAVVSCLGGMVSKEVMVSAPVIVLLFERTFITGSLSSAIRRSWPLYAGLVSTWLLLVILLRETPHGDTAGFGLGVSAFSYWLTQTKILLMYLKLFLWPSPLVIHYELPYLQTFGDAWMYVVAILVLGIATLVLLWRNSPVGFLMAWMAAILAPTSVVPIVTEMAAERRMYLPIAALLILVVVAVYRLAHWTLPRLKLADKERMGLMLTRAAAAITATAALTYGLVSAKRLEVYSDPFALWSELMRYEPDNFLAHYNRGLVLNRTGHLSEGIKELQHAVRVKPEHFGALSSLGLALLSDDRTAEAVDVLSQAVKLEPNSPVALNNLGLALNTAGNPSEAAECLQRAIELKPNFDQAHNNLGAAFGRLGDNAKAIEEFHRALELNKDNTGAHNNLGVAYSNMGENAEAIEQFRLTLQLNPKANNARRNLAALLAEAGQVDEAIAQYQQGIEQQP